MTIKQVFKLVLVIILFSQMVCFITVLAERIAPAPHDYLKAYIVGLYFTAAIVIVACMSAVIVNLLNSAFKEKWALSSTQSSQHASDVLYVVLIWSLLKRTLNAHYSYALYVTIIQVFPERTHNQLPSTLNN